ncbi:hypothetical protein L9F63_010314, partial [Diploptera punctata]
TNGLRYQIRKFSISDCRNFHHVHDKQRRRLITDNTESGQNQSYELRSYLHILLYYLIVNFL